MSTSVAYLTKRLNDIGRHDLLAAVDAGQLSTFAAAHAAGLIHQRSRVLGTGSMNQARKRAFAVARATTGQPLAEPEPQPAPVSPLPPEIRDIITRLVKLDRADLIIAVAEQRMDPFEAAGIAERGVSERQTAKALGVSRDTVRRDTGRTTARNHTKGGTKKATGREAEDAAARAEPKKPVPPAIDVRCLIG